ncbi:thermosome subunit alpha [Methermicoccus shengliensis]|uniref:Thermosome subunit n=1 Tax=Methermicoccus shengliensis TaxID=660064 RepID=A0A832VY01_9EURY|nr:thermosome subunit alpha [Methermicoccus shengliensis]KUK04815.1 MAG: Thermosome [Euryarchaeota archaeon 55_53]KUK29573.1 MAG: Thermosome [Methanosarcinales archeaon 56_1174]MDI3487732.1 archaeal chaperonin [Methanosarcinales archaeon]MDN5295502.1 archaeal chaperonin [Methanosarcinales archaeon]HIH70263.1 thermosome subunit [Methermicoccus shengliensis]
MARGTGDKVVVPAGHAPTGQPVFVITDKEKTSGRDARHMNILAARAVVDSVKSTLGPLGMDKMLIDPLGNITVTNDGAVILREMSIEHPSAKMVIDGAKTQEDVAGDGTTSVVVLVGALLDAAEKLMDAGVHPTVLVSGYKMAAERAQQVLDSLARRVERTNDATLREIAKTAMMGKGPEVYADTLAEMCVRAVKGVEDNGAVDVKENIKLIKRVGLRSENTELINGIVIDKERSHPSMPRRVKNAKIALLNKGIEAKKPQTKAKMKIESAEQLAEFMQEDVRVVEEQVKRFAELGVNVVMTEMGIDDIGNSLLSKYGIFAVERLLSDDLKRISRAVGARIVSTASDLKPEDLGEAGLVEEVGKAGFLADKYIYIHDAKNTKAVTIVIHAGSENVADEVERALEDALKVVACAVEDQTVVAGGAAPEMEMALRLRQYANTLKGREQLAVQAYAEALEAIPKALAENSGLDVIDTLVALRSAHEGGRTTAGIDVFSGDIIDMWEANVIEPLRVKRQMISTATEIVCMILRLDEILASERREPSIAEKHWPKSYEMAKRRGMKGNIPGT